MIQHYRATFCDPVTRDDPESLQSFMGAYIYNAGGERAWKFTGPVNYMTLNGKTWFYVADLNFKTLYSSPYLVATDQAYTKHYYIEGERVASKIGASFETDLNPVNPARGVVSTITSDYEAMMLGMQDYIQHSVECSDLERVTIEIDPNIYSLEDHVGDDLQEQDLYFYHSDHLGSSSFITDASGNAIQHLQYMPFGESFVDQRLSNWNTPYTFSGKEKDEETGYSYFGARYYDSDLSIWLSVDPLADKNHGISPYNYCSFNPILIIDPDGRDGRITFTENEDGTNTVVYNSTIHVYGKNAKQAVENANSQFSKLNNQSNVEIDGIKYQVQLNVTYVYDEELDALGKNVFDLTFDDLSKLSSYQEGDNILQVGVPEGGGTSGFVGESERGGTFGYSLTTDGVDVVHESLHNLGLADTYGGCCTPRKGFEKDIMTVGPERGKEINSHHFSELGFMSKYFLNRGKKMLSEGYRPTNFKRDSSNPSKYHIVYQGTNPDHIRGK